MAVTLSGVVGLIGAGTVDEADLSNDVAQAVSLLRRYLRHLRHVAEDGTVTGVVVTYDETGAGSGDPTWTWEDQRAVEDDDLIPADVLDRCTEQVASELNMHRKAPGGIVNTQFVEDPAGSGPARLRRDPLTPAYSLLAHWTVPF